MYHIIYGYIRNVNIKIQFWLKLNKKECSILEENAKTFELLLDSNIISILSGYYALSPIMRNHMPELTYYKLEEISEKFGLTVDDDNISVQQYLYIIIEHCIQKNCVSELLSCLFAKKQFINEKLGSDPQEIEDCYNMIVGDAMFCINNVLSYNDMKLVVSNGQYNIIPINSFFVETPKVNKIDRDYIILTYKNALTDISTGNYDGCLTKSRTLLEEVFCKVIEDKGEKPKSKGKINELFNQVKELYKMEISKDKDNDMDLRIIKLLSGLNTIVQAISEMRNYAGDAHGMGARRYKVLEHHARLALNSALTLAEFVYSVAENSMPHEE